MPVPTADAVEGNALHKSLLVELFRALPVAGT